MNDVPRRVDGGVWTVVLGYALFSALWILLSDRAVEAMFQDPAALVRASIFKGWFFVLVTSVLLYALVTRFAAAQAAAYERELAIARERKQPPAMLVAIAEASSDAIFAKDEAGRYLLLNQAAARMAGREAGQMLGQDNREVFPPAQAEHLSAIERRVFETGQPETSEETVQTAQGERVMLVTKGPLRGPDGRIFGTYGIARDVTERKQAEHALQSLADDLSATLQAIPDLMFELDAEGHYIKVKVLNEALPAVPPEQVLGHTVNDILPADAAATVMQALSAAGRVGTDFGRTMTLTLPSGTHHFELSVARKPVVDGQGERFIVLSRDITSRHAAEAELRQRNQELERFNRAAVERELRMVALKREVNALALAAGQPAPYDLGFADAPGAKASP